MSGLFYQLGRKLGRAAVPLARKSKWVWASLTGTEAEALQAETALGRAMAAAMRAAWRGVEEPNDAALLTEICQRLTARVRNKLRTFQAEVMHSGGLTALALPGGFIFVDHSLLDLCDRQADELAFVVGHEMAHVICEHAFDRLVARVGTDAVASLLGRSAFGPWLRQTGLKLLQSAYSRDNELEADELGARLAQAAGYDPAGAFRLLERLGRRRGSGGELGDYFASHPPENERLAHLKTVLAAG
jgi:predicted Zn-dependent protease